MQAGRTLCGAPICQAWPGSHCQLLIAGRRRLAEAPRRRESRETITGYFRRLRLQHLVEKRQAHVHPIVDIGVVVVELFVGMADAGRGPPLGQGARALWDVILVAPTAVAVESARALPGFPGLSRRGG